MDNITNLPLDIFKLSIAAFLIALNGFFVAAEFALVKIKKSKLERIKNHRHAMSAPTALWLYERRNLALSACQIGITMASIALGWVGESAIAHLIGHYVYQFGVTSEVMIHSIAFTIAFTIITTLHIVLGEQVPKIYAITRPETVLHWSSWILKVFYLVLYPFMYVLNVSTVKLLQWIGVDNPNVQEMPLTEDEILDTLRLSQAGGEVSTNEHRLIHAVFKFDDQMVRNIMLPRGRVKFVDCQLPFSENLEYIKRSNHSRFPLCDHSLDKILGIIHIKDLIGFSHDNPLNFKSIMRAPVIVHETMRITTLLNKFKQVKNHLALVQDEHGTLIGIVTLEDVLEQLVGSMQDEFDLDKPVFVKESECSYIVEGGLKVEHLNERFDIKLVAENSDTLSGLLHEQAETKLSKGSEVRLNDVILAEVLKMDGIRVSKARLIFSDPAETTSND